VTWRLLALDLDDTLLGPDRKADEIARKVVRIARDAGIVPVVATGRPYASAQLFARRLRTDAPVIANNGAVVRAEDGTHLRELHLDEEIWSSAISTAEDEGWVIYVYTPGAIYSNRSHPDTWRYARILEVPIIISEELLRQIRESAEPVVAVGLRVQPEEGPEVEDDCRQLFGGEAQVMRSVPTLIEMLPRGADKGQALEFLCAHLDIPVERSVAVGDGRGDIEMLKAAGCGVFVSNADRKLHRLADWVTDHPHTHGVMQLVRRLRRENSS